MRTADHCDRRLATGLFLPVANHNWVMSRSGPDDPATFARNLAVTRRAEAMGMDFVLAQSVWRGHGGDIRFWDDSLECFTTCAALAAATERIGLVASVMPALYPPAVAAKMAATVDDVSGGRFGLNLVAGANLREFEQMGALPDDWPAVKYEYAAEWLGVVRRLWSEDRVTHRGRWFRLDDCVCGPKPVQRPGPPVLCAGASPAGMAFTSRHADHAFVGGRTTEAVAALARDYRAAAASEGRELDVYTVTMLVLAPTIAEAEDRIARYEADPDLEAIADHHGEYAKPTAGASLRRNADEPPPVWFGSRPEPLTPGLLADRFHALFEAGVDGILCSAADWQLDLDLLEQEVLPDLRRRNVVAPWPAGAKVPTS